MSARSTLPASSGSSTTREHLHASSPPSAHTPPSAYKHDSASLDDWISILRLSSKWAFSQVQELALRYIEAKPIDPLVRITLYHQLALPRALLIPAYTSFVARPEPPTNAEAEALGLECALAVFRAREWARAAPPKTRGGARTGGAVHAGGEELAAFVRETFFTLPVHSPLRDGANDTAPGRRMPSIAAVAAHGAY
jgi:hypothetical protein